MPRLLLAVVALFATVSHAQTGDEPLEEIFAMTAANAVEQGHTVVLGPVMEAASDRDEVSPYNVDLEAGAEYLIFLASAPDSGLNPDVTLYGPDGTVAVAGLEDGHSEGLTFLPLRSGEYIVAVTLNHCVGDDCEFGLLVVRL